MFNWFKNKIELKDEKSIMSSTSNKKGVKIGSEIIVPNNFECLIYYHGKYFNTLTSGKHKLDKSKFESLINYQQKNKSKLKRVKFISHYISTSNQQVEFTFKKIKYTVNFIIEDNIKFAELMLLYAYKVDNSYTYEYTIEVFKELLMYHKYDCNQIKDSSLNDFGILIKSFTNDKQKASIFSNNSTTNSSTNSNKKSIEKSNTTSHNSNTEHDNNTSNNTSSNTSTETSSNQASHNVNFPQCPKCGNVTKFATTYCLKCGYKLQ